MGGAGGNEPDPGEIERRLRELDKEIGKPRAHEPSALERLAAAKKAEKKAQRKRDTRVLTALAAVFVFEPPGRPAQWMRIVQQRYGWVNFARWDDPGGHLEPWVSIGGGAAGGQCGERDGYIHPDFPHGPPPSVTPSGAPQDPYSLATPSASSGSGCHSVTRT